MAELNRQDSIKLNKKYQFRISTISTVRSFKNKYKNSSVQKYFKRQKENKQADEQLCKTKKHLNLPQFKRALQKIGAIQKCDQVLFQPEQADQNEFRNTRRSILKKKLFKTVEKNKKQQCYYSEQLDQAVLDCWQYGENINSKMIWKKYRQNLDDLSYFTLKVTSKKKIH